VIWKAINRVIFRNRRIKEEKRVDEIKAVEFV